MRTSHPFEFTIFGVIIGTLLTGTVYFLSGELALQIFIAFAVVGMIYFLYISLTRYWRTQK